MKDKTRMRYITSEFLILGQIIKLGDSNYEVLSRVSFNVNLFVYQVKKIKKIVYQLV